MRVGLLASFANYFANNLAFMLDFYINNLITIRLDNYTVLCYNSEDPSVWVQHAELLYLTREIAWNR